MPIYKLPGNPTNPNVPTVGFADDFNRSDGPLGFTPIGNKPYIQLDSVPANPGVVRVTSNRAQATSLGGFVYEVLECYEPNGTLSVTAAAVGNRQGGLAFRAKDAFNLIRLGLRVSAAGPQYILQLVSSTVPQQNLATSSVTSNNDDKIAITGDGPLIRVIVNGTQIMSASTPYFVNETKHGMSFAQTDVAFKNLAFAAA